MATTAEHLRTIALSWTDLADALGGGSAPVWPPAGRMSDYQRHLAEADADLAEAARHLAAYRRQFLDRDPNQIGETRPPISIPIFDVMRAVEAGLIHCADQVAAAVQRSPMPFAPRTWPTADRARRDQLARADSVDPRRWRYGGRHTAPHTALWLLARVQGRPGPFRPLPDREHRLIANVAEEAARRIEDALDVGERKATLARPCPDCGGRLQLHGGAGAPPVARCTSCGHVWGGQPAVA
ncbi:hypothetical protein [Streptomyces scabiei]|uniref:hypothetical protein n=1 Tax=Streptomyces scabiei TaxID=1930 RepID=UPI0029AF56E9|nr:hypothetical protein [Streptomyces scabiei]MDX3034174.1 hypothetical protein [Streptomyces scabiei]